MTLAARDGEIAATLARSLGSATFRLYHTDDTRGVEIGGAAKNVLAIAAGIVTGRRLGASAVAALTTRGFAELFRFGQAFGAQARDLDGPVRVGRSDPHLLERAVAQLFVRAGARQGPDAAAGAARAASSRRVCSPHRFWSTMAHAKGVEMPIASAVADILDGRIGVDDAIENLLTRPFRAEG